MFEAPQELAAPYLDNDVTGTFIVDRIYRTFVNHLIDLSVVRSARSASRAALPIEAPILQTRTFAAP
jgi:hypothetical protein